jgi:imidazolonepropionase-like amidohydrolase
VKGKKLVAVGHEGQVAIPSDAGIVDCTGLVTAPGFWNCHAHVEGRAR